MVHNKCDVCSREYSQRRGGYQFAPTCSRRCDKISKEHGKDDAFARLLRSHRKGMTCLSYGRREPTPPCESHVTAVVATLQ